jgi:hypothetical protein
MFHHFRLDKLAQLANIVAVIPASYCAYVAWVSMHPQSLASTANEVNIKLAWVSLGCFIGLVTFGGVTSIIAYSRRKKVPVVQPVVEQPKNDNAKVPEPILPPAESPLQDRVGNLARELLQFLQAQGPAPVVGGPDWRASVKEALKTNWERLPKIHDGFMARFHDRVENIIYELGALGVRDWELNNLVNQAAHSEGSIESIANRLLALGSQLVVQEYTSRFQISQSNQSAVTVSALRPKVVPVSFAPDVKLSPLLGLFIANDGEPAYDVSIPDASLGKAKIKFKTAISRLAKADGNKFCEVWIEKDVNFSVGGGTLFEEMRTREIDEVDFVIRYKDNENHWYVTTCKLERNVSVGGGIVVRYIGQEIAQGLHG